MPKPEWGVKRSCLSCGARFYDLQRNPAICPKCGAEFDLSLLSKPRRIKAEKASPVATAAVAPDLIDDETEETDDLDTVEDDDALAHTDEEEEEDTAAPVKKPEVADTEDEDDLSDYSDDPLIDEDEDDDDFDDVLGEDKNEESR